jgi:hypothetical protein
VNGSGFVYFASANTNITSETTGWSFLGVTYSGLKSTFSVDPFGRNTFGNDISTIANLNSGVSFNEGDLIFVRQEANAIDMPQFEERFLYVYDTTPPVVEPIALLTDNVGPDRTFDESTIGRRPNIARALNKIDIVLRTNEPVIFSYSAPVANGVNLFKVSGVSFTSGFTGCVSNTPTANDCQTGGSQSGYSTYLFNALRPTVSPGDTEGLFSFTGLNILDRAGNGATVGSSNFTGYSIWIDPIKPAITSSGFVNNNIIYSGLSQDEDNVLSFWSYSNVWSRRLKCISSLWRIRL